MTYFSIVIPLYNKKQHIERAIHSVLDQTYQQFELIVVNDGSDDGGEQLIREKFANKIRIINQENQGASIARNTGILKSKYSHVCLLDADDEWKPIFLEEISKLIELHPEYNIYSLRHEIITEDGELIRPTTYLPNKYRGVIKNFIETFRKSECIINSSSVCLKKDYFHKLGGFPAGQTQGEDVYLWLLYAVHTDLVFCNCIGSRYYRNATNRSVDRIPKKKLPFHFYHFYRILNNSSDNDQIRESKKDLLEYLQKDALLHIADLKVKNNPKTAIAHTFLLWNNNKKTWVLCFLVLLLPRFLLKYLKDYRNLKRSTL